MRNKLATLLRRTVAGEKIDRDEYGVLLDKSLGLNEICYGANLLREQHSGQFVDFCAIINARSGACSENCAFCSQSSHHNSNVPVYDLVEGAKIRNACAKAQEDGAARFGVVTSGPTPSADDIAAIAAHSAEIISGGGLPVCVSLGKLGRDDFARLKKAGVKRVHCNLETSEKFFPQICTTHSWAEKTETIRLAHEMGFEVCSGGILGMGEDWCDRLDMALALKDLGVNSVPLNFLMPRPGTPLEGRTPLEPRETLRIIALFRYVLPDRDIRICGGRADALRSLQSWIFHAGANGIMTGDYLTSPGCSPGADRHMVADLELELRQHDA